MKAAKEIFSNEDDQVLYDFFINLADAINPKLKFPGMTLQDVTQHNQSSLPYQHAFVDTIFWHAH